MDNRCFKLEIFIPETHFTDLRKALQNVDAGQVHDNSVRQEMSAF